MEALTAHEERVHGGHFGSDKGVNAVEDGSQVSKLQFLEGQAVRRKRKHSYTALELSHIEPNRVEATYATSLDYLFEFLYNSPVLSVLPVLPPIASSPASQYFLYYSTVLSELYPESFA